MSEDEARAHHFTISLVRLAAAMFVVLGILIVQGLIALPSWTGYLLIGFGLINFFILPTLLAKRWSSRNE